MSDGAVERGELITAGGASPEAPAEEEEGAEFVSEPAKVMRVGSMIKQLLEEVRSTQLDEPSPRPAAGDLRHLGRRSSARPCRPTCATS